jgi:hypothetical protein
VRAAILAPALALAGVRGIAAQPLDTSQAFRTTAEGISAGRFVLYPSLVVDTIYDNNIFYESEDVPNSELVSSGELIVAPRIMVDLPLSRSRVRFAYSPQYRDYSSDQYVQTDHVSHLFDLEAWARFTSLSVALREHYVQGTQEVQAFDPGGEVRFGLVPFTLSEPAAEIGLIFGARHRFDLTPRFSTLNFDDSGQSGFYDYERRGLAGRYSYQIDPVTLAYTAFSRDSTDQERESLLLSKVHVDTRYAGAGLSRTFAGAVVAAVSAGYETQNYEGGTGQDFSGLVYDINLTWTASDLYRFEVGARRQPYQSFSVINSFYLNRELRLRMTQQLGRNALWQIGAILYQNEYATVREDRTLRLDLGAGFRVSRLLRLSLGYNHEVRHSNIGVSVPGEPIAPFDFTVDRVFLRIEAGYL